METLQVMPVRSVKCFQKEDMNNLSRSDTMFIDRPFSQYHVSKNKTASSLAVSLVEVGMIRMSDDKRSVIVRMQVKG